MHIGMQESTPCKQHQVSSGPPLQILGVVCARGRIVEFQDVGLLSGTIPVPSQGGIIPNLKMHAARCTSPKQLERVMENGRRLVYIRNTSNKILDMIDSWNYLGPAAGLGLMSALVLCKYVESLRLVGVAIIVFSVYNALELWRFDRVVGVQNPPLAQEKLFISDPQIDRESLSRAFASKSDEWIHTSHRVLVWNPRRSQLHLFAGINPVVALCLWFGIYGGGGAILTSVLLLSCLLKFQTALDLFQQLALESTQKQVEHAIWKHNSTKRATPPRILTRMPSSNLTKPHYGLPSPATSAQNSPSQTSFNSSFNSSFSSGGSPATQHTLLFPDNIAIPRVRLSTMQSPGGKIVPPQNPRRTSSYRASTVQPLEVPEMAPRRVASMASRDNMRKRFQQAA